MRNDFTQAAGDPRGLLGKKVEEAIHTYGPLLLLEQRSLSLQLELCQAFFPLLWLDNPRGSAPQGDAMRKE